MNFDGRFKFKKYDGRKEECPECGTKNVFVRYIDTVTQELIHARYGRCDREDKCGYFVNPYRDPAFIRGVRNTDGVHTAPPPKPASFHDNEFLGESDIVRQTYCMNFSKSMICEFGIDIFKKIALLYYLRSIRRWNEPHPIFWQVDIEGRVRGGKIIGYGEDGKRLKCTRNGRKIALINWVHSINKMPDFNLSQCFYGEHLLTRYPKATVYIVESEKSAIWAACKWGCDDNRIWIASGSLTGLTTEKCLVLIGREICLCPDIGKGTEVWENSMIQLETICPAVSVAGYIEQGLGEDGDDVVDIYQKK